METEELMDVGQKEKKTVVFLMNPRQQRELQKMKTCTSHLWPFNSPVGNRITALLRTRVGV
jgi:hypothetical protein